MKKKLRYNKYNIQFNKISYFISISLLVSLVNRLLNKWNNIKNLNNKKFLYKLNFFLKIVFFVNKNLLNNIYFSIISKKKLLKYYVNL